MTPPARDGDSLRGMGASPDPTVRWPGRPGSASGPSLVHRLVDGHAFLSIDGKCDLQRLGIDEATTLGHVGRGIVEGSGGHPRGPCAAPSGAAVWRPRPDPSARKAILGDSPSRARRRAVRVRQMGRPGRRRRRPARPRARGHRSGPRRRRTRRGPPAGRPRAPRSPRSPRRGARRGDGTGPPNAAVAAIQGSSGAARGPGHDLVHRVEGGPGPGDAAGPPAGHRRERPGPVPARPAVDAGMRRSSSAEPPPRRPVGERWPR